MATGDDAGAAQPKELGLADAMALARELQKEDRLEAADELYRRILALAPDDPDALHFRGVVAFQLGRLAEAESLIRRAVEVAPSYSDAHNNLGNVLQHQKRAEEAVPCYERAIELQPGLADAHNNLGNALQQQKRHEEAVGLYERAIALRPEMADAHLNLGKALEALDRMSEALTAYRQAVLLRPFHFDSYRRLGSALYGWGRIDEAADVYRKWLSLEPENPLAQHLLAACTGYQVPARASDACVRNIFEGFADSFDQILEKLEYRAPALVAQAAADVLGTPEARLDILDAGCGTGLCAEHFKPFARRLVGVDLSVEMLKRAAMRKLYDELILGELTAFVGAVPAAWDHVVSADTLVYFGDLAPVMAAAQRGLRPGGHLVFTLERTDEGLPQGFKINPHGRYSHTETYVRQVLAAARLEPRQIARVHLRLELKKPVEGLLVVASRGA
ncbi:MAG TPA: tetratricopeptide repeat protein [Candidatus Binatia bacterium]|nr:tetratricopeptide repeat protein [Candidatus Binatia bacterium]